MKFLERRKQILHTLSTELKPISGAILAKMFGVTRPIIVGDIGNLRSEGYPIISTPKGYVLLSNYKNKINRVIVCQHDYTCVENELKVVIKNKGVLLNTSIEHNIYGTIEASLFIRNKEDISQFMRKIENSNNNLLSNLTNGIHTHLIETETIEQMEKLVAELDKLHIIYH